MGVFINPSYGQTNLLPNGDFENGYSAGWTHQANNGGAANYSEESTSLMNGSTKALKCEILTVTASGFNVSSLSSKIHVDEGLNYVVSFYGKKAGATGNVNMVFQSPGKFQGFQVTLTDEWALYTHTFTSQATADDMQVRLWYLDAGSTYYIDNVSCVKEGDVTPPPTVENKPNFIFYLSDDQDKLDYGCYGNPNVKTPTVDKLAAEGMIFQSAYTGQAICAPSRAQLYTGKYPLRNGLFIQHSDSYSGQKSVTAYLKSQGYDVILAGKSHVAPDNVYNWTTSLGFETIAGIEPEEAVPITKIKDYLSSTTKPFCIFVASHYPHPPYSDSSNYKVSDVVVHPYMSGKAAGRTGYYASIENDDKQIKAIVDFVDSNPKFDNTVFVYSADHGSAGKYTPYEPGVNVPFVVRWKGKVQAGTVSNALIHYTDVVPTFLDIAGAPVLTDLDGKSFLKVLTGETATHNEYVYGVVTNQNVQNPEIFPARSVRGERFKYIRNTNSIEVYENNLGSDQSLNAFIERGAKNHPKIPYEEVYDLQNDPWEKVNLAKDPAYATERQLLSDKLDAWMVQQNDFLRFYPAPLVVASEFKLDESGADNNIPSNLEGTLANSEFLRSDRKPLKPRALSAERISPNSVLLNWTPSIYSADVTQYDILQNGTVVKSIDVSSPSVKIEGLAAGVDYTFAVRSKNIFGNSDLSNQVKAGEPALTETNLLDNGDFEAGYNINWTLRADDGGVVDFSEITNSLPTQSSKGLKANVVSLGANRYNTSIVNGTKGSVEQGKTYIVSFYAKKESTSEAKIKLVFQSTDQFLTKDFTLTQDWTKYTYSFTATSTASDLQIRLWFLNIGVAYAVDNVNLVAGSPTQPDGINLDITKTDQTVTGFGYGMKRDTKNFYTTASPSIREKVIEKLYKDVQVNSIRFFVYSDMEMTNDNDDPFVTNQDGFVWRRYEDTSPKQSNECQYVVTALKDAMNASSVGIKHLIGNSNSAPPYLKTDGVIKGKGGKLIAGGEDEYSEFLVEFLKGMKRRYDINVNYISPFNEPDYDVDYENMIPTAEECIPILKNLDQRLNTEGLTDVKIIAPECFRVETSDQKTSTVNYINKIFKDNAAKQAVDIVATHTYADLQNTAGWNKLKVAAQGKEVWVTESSTLEDPDITMNNAQIIIKWILQGFNDGGLTAYNYHIGYSRDPGAMIIYNDADIILPKRYFAFKQIVNYVKPNYKRLQANLNKSNITGSSFISPDNKKIVLLVYNEGSATTYPINLPAGVQSVEHIVTSNLEGNDAKTVDDISFSVGNASINLSLPSKSFHTIVLNMLDLTTGVGKDVLAVPVGMQIDIYPNPVNDKFNLKYPVLKSDCDLSIYTTTGTKVLSVKLKKGSTRDLVDIAHIAQGIYVLRISGDNTFYNAKIIKN